MAKVISYKGQKYVRVDDDIDLVKYSKDLIDSFKEARDKWAADLKTIDAIIPILTKALDAAKKGDADSAKQLLKSARDKNKSKANGFAFEIIHRF